MDSFRFLEHRFWHWFYFADEYYFAKIILNKMSIAFYAIFSLFILKWLWDEEKKRWNYILAGEFVCYASFNGIRWKMANGMFIDLLHPLSRQRSVGRIYIMKYVKLIYSPEKYAHMMNQQKKWLASERERERVRMKFMHKEV